MSLPIHIFLDSSCLHSLTPDSIIARNLGGLAKEKAIRIHVPWIVEFEIRTQLHGLRTVYKDYSAISNWFPMPERATFRTLLSQTRELISKSNHLTDKGFSDWLHEIEAIRELPSSEQTIDVFKRYFSGESPFRSLKQRSDLPDAFIYACIRSFAVSHADTIHAVVADNRLRAELSKIDKIMTHADFSTIFSLPEIAPKAALLDLVAAFNQTLDKHIGKIGRKIGEMILDSEVTAPIDLDDVFFDAEYNIIDYGEIENIHFEEKEAELLSETSFQMPFSCMSKSSKIRTFLIRNDFLVDEAALEGDELFENYIDYCIKGTIVVEMEETTARHYELNNIDISIEDVDSLDA